MIKQIIMAYTVLLAAACSTVWASSGEILYTDQSYTLSSAVMEPDLNVVTDQFSLGKERAKASDDSSAINWSYILAGAGTAVGALSVFGGSSGGSDPISADMFAPGTDTPSHTNPDAPCLLLALIGLPSVLKLAGRNK